MKYRDNIVNMAILLCDDPKYWEVRRQDGKKVEFFLFFFILQIEQRVWRAKEDSVFS
jgi:hypothetical protein